MTKAWWRYTRRNAIEKERTYYSNVCLTAFLSIVLQKNRTRKKKKYYSAAGNRTPVSRVTGGDTNHYTTADRIDWNEFISLIESNCLKSFYFITKKTNHDMFEFELSLDRSILSSSSTSPHVTTYSIAFFPFAGLKCYMEILFNLHKKTLRNVKYIIHCC